MILGEKELAWQLRVIDAAYAAGWAVFLQKPPRRSQNQALPSMVLARGDRVLAVYLRSKVRRDRMPPAAEFAERTGLAAVVWTPERWSAIVGALSGWLDVASTLPSR